MARREGVRGCAVAILAWPLLVVMAPFAALVRWWQRRRRGTGTRVEWNLEDGAPLTVADLRADVPSTLTARARRHLVDAVVRLAEKLHDPGEGFALVWREAGSVETELVAVGRRPQELGQRLDTALSHRGFDRRTQLWLTLPAGAYLAEYVDPLVFDPEVEGAVKELLGHTDPLWAMEITFARGSPSTLYRIRFHVPARAREVVTGVLTGLRERLETLEV